MTASERGQQLKNRRTNLCGGFFIRGKPIDIIYSNASGMALTGMGGVPDLVTLTNKQLDRQAKQQAKAALKETDQYYPYLIKFANEPSPREATRKALKIE